MSFLTIQLAHAPAGETYTLTPSSNRVQEYNTPGVTLYLNVTRANTSNNYQFTFTVTDPSGSRANATTPIITGQAAFVAGVVYPRDFTTIMRYVGNYTINVAQIQPGNKPTVATGRFLAGLTDSVSYQRTYQVSMKGDGFAVLENINITLSHGSVPALGFPLVQPADMNGGLSFAWQIPADATTGTYTVSFVGQTTIKAPLDIQTFTVSPTDVTIPGLTVNSPTIARTLTQQFLFAPQYPNGQRVQTGRATVRIGDGVTYVYTNGTYDVLNSTFRATYRLPANALGGIWVATIDTDQFDDGYGNRGPALTPPAAGFYVQPATLSVSIDKTALPIGKTFGAGDLIPIYASIKYPDGTLVNSGVVTAKLFSQSGILIGTPLNFTYFPGQQEWAGSYQVKYNDPSGIWVVRVDASDQPGNAGEEIVSAIVSIPPLTPPASQPSGLNTSSFLLIAAVVAAGALGLLAVALVLHRKKTIRSEVKLDLRVVDKEVDRIQESAFFQRVKKQVENTKGARSGEPSREATEGGGDSQPP